VGAGRGSRQHVGVASALIVIDGRQVLGSTRVRANLGFEVA